MNKTITFLFLIIFSITTFAQKGKVSSALNLKDTGKLGKALESINTAIDENNSKAKKSISWPKTWEARGDIYKDLYYSTDEKLKEQCDDPLGVALKSYKKAAILDTRNKLVKKLKVKLTLLTNDFSKQASEAYNNENYELALQSFEQIIEINSMKIVSAENPTIDTAVIFNAGITAFAAEKYDIAAEYLEKSAKLNYNGAKTYNNWASALKLNKDTVASLEALKLGFNQYPEDNDILSSMLQIYLDWDKNNDALEFCEKAIKQDPTNAIFYMVKGSLLEKLNNTTEAISFYNKAVELNDKYFDAYYNLGVIYFNKGVNQYTTAADVPTNENEKYKLEMKKANEFFLQSLPYMEKCKELEPDNRYALESLKNIYYRLIPSDKTKYETKYTEIDKLLN